jgi:hypothetical protein
VGGAISYQWNLPTGVTAVGPNNLSAINLAFGPAFSNGIVEVIATYACGTASTSIAVDGVPPAPTITPADICSTLTDVTYNAMATSATQYNWSFTGATVDPVCDNPPLCDEYTVFAWAAGGSMTVTAQNTCGTSAPTNLFTNCRMMNSAGDLFDTKVYPNPTHGQVTVEFHAQKSGNCAIEVTDITGRSVLSRQLKAAEGINRHAMDLGFVSAGVYMVHVKDAEGNTSVIRLTVE